VGVLFRKKSFQSAGADSQSNEIVHGRLSTPVAKGEIVFPGAPLIGMTFDCNGVVGVGLQPDRLLLQGILRIRR
jgi:hypothetical protein